MKLAIAYVNTSSEQPESSIASSVRFQPGAASISPALLDEFFPPLLLTDVKLSRGLATPPVTHLSLQLLHRPLSSSQEEGCPTEPTPESILAYLHDNPQLLQINDTLMIPTFCQVSSLVYYYKVVRLKYTRDVTF